MVSKHKGITKKLRGIKCTNWLFKMKKPVWIWKSMLPHGKISMVLQWAQQHQQTTQPFNHSFNQHQHSSWPWLPLHPPWWHLLPSIEPVISVTPQCEDHHLQYAGLWWWLALESRSTMPSPLQWIATAITVLSSPPPPPSWVVLPSPIFMS